MRFEMLEIVLIHLPNIRVPREATPLALNLLPTAVYQSLLDLRLAKADYLVLSGDIVARPSSTAFSSAYNIIKACADLCGKPEIITAPGDTDVTTASQIESLLIRSLRSLNRSGRNTVRLTKLEQREKDYVQFARQIESPSIVHHSHLRTKSYVSTQSNCSFMVLDSAFFSLENSSDRRRLLIGGPSLLNLIDAHKNTTINFLVIHHHPSWLAPAERQIFEQLVEPFMLVIYGHDENDHSEVGQLSLQTGAYLPVLGPYSSNREYQISHIRSDMKEAIVYVYVWNGIEFRWNLFSKNSIPLHLDEFDMNYSEKGGLTMDPGIMFLIEVGRFALSELKERWKARRQSNVISMPNQSRTAGNAVDLSQEPASPETQQQLQEWLNQLSKDRIETGMREIKIILRQIGEEQLTRYGDDDERRRQTLTKSAYDQREQDRKRIIAEYLERVEALLKDHLGLEIDREKLL